MTTETRTEHFQWRRCRPMGAGIVYDHQLKDARQSALEIARERSRVIYVVERCVPYTSADVTTYHDTIASTDTPQVGDKIAYIATPADAESGEHCVTCYQIEWDDVDTAIGPARRCRHCGDRWTLETAR